MKLPESVLSTPRGLAGAVTRPARRPRPSTVVAVGIGVVLLAGLVTQCVFAAARPTLFAAGHDTPNAVLGVLGDGLGALAVGVLLAARLPRNPIGWLLLAFATSTELITGCAAIAQAGYDTPGHVSTFARVMLVAAEVSQVGVTALGPILVLLPTGRVVSRWRRRLLWLFGLDALAMVAAMAVRPTYTSVVGPTVANPVGIGGSAAVRVAEVGVFLAIVLTAVFIVDAVVRSIRARGLERQQMKVIGCAAVGTVLVFVGSSWIPQSSTWNSAAWFVASNLLAVAIGVALVRYRLYDLDRVVSRTLSYAIVTGVLIGVYIGVVALATRVLPFSSPVGVAASTLCAAALFSPLRRRVQRVVDRRFNRARYNADATVAAFRERLRAAVDLNAVRAELETTVDRALEPVHIGVWVRAEAPAAN